MPDRRYARVVYVDNDNARTAGTTTLRTHAEISGFFDGLRLLEPGLVQVQRWQPGSAAPGDGEQIAAYAGLARKP